MSKIKIEIESVLGKILFTYEKENNTIKDTLVEAINKQTNLSDANLRDANLHNADLSGADLRNADLRNAYLRDAYLSDADLSNADLSNADLSGAYLSDTYILGANLSNAYLRDAYMSGSYLSDIKEDFLKILDAMPQEVEQWLNEKLRVGKINGAVYEGDCACLIGSFAQIKKCHYEDLSVVPNSRRPAERWFLSIKPGQTPKNSPKCKITEEWTEEWMQKNKVVII